MDVLVVDDDESVSHVIAEFLQSHDCFDGSPFKVSFAKTCAGALAILHDRNNLETRFDCIVLDWVLKEGPANACIPELRRVAPFTGIVIVTGYEDLELAVQSFRAGADGFVPKTALTKQLLLSITDVVTFRRRRYDDYKVLGSRLDTLEKLAVAVSDGIQDIKAIREQQSETT